MTLRFGSIVIHKPEQNSEGESINNTSGEETEIAEIAELANLKYNKKVNHLRRTDRQRRSHTKSRNSSMEARRSSTSSSSSSEGPILRAMKTDDRSPPLVRSQYSSPMQDRLDAKPSVISQSSTRRKMSSMSAKELYSDYERLGFKAITSRSGTTDKLLNRRKTFSAVPDATSSFTTPFVPILDEEVANGLSKLLKNLNFAERLRQQKAEQARLNIHKLPQHMREQLKHIYVY